MKKVLILFFLIANIGVAFSQETVHTKNGSIIVGVVTEENGKINVRTNGGNVFVYDTTDVQKITRDCKSDIQTVFMKNGAIIKGCVIERKLGKSISVRTNDGNILNYDIEDVQFISDGEKNKKSNNRYTSYQQDLYTGYRGFIDYSVFFGWNDLAYGGLFTTIHGGYVIPYLFVGGGVSFGADLYKMNYNDYGHNLEIVIPLLFNLKGYYPLRNGNGGPFLDFRMGLDVLNYNLYDEYFSTSFSTSLAVGWRWNIDEGAWNVSVGWRGKTPYWIRGNQLIINLGFEF